MSDEPERKKTNREMYQERLPNGHYREPWLWKDVRYDLLLKAGGNEELAKALIDINDLQWNLSCGPARLGFAEAGDRIRALEATVAKLEERIAALESRSSLALPTVNEP